MAYYNKPSLLLLKVSCLSPEMEFLNGPLAWFLGINSSLCLVIYPHFSVLQNVIHELSRLSYFADFFVRKTREKYGFLENPPGEGSVNSMEQKTRVFWQIDVQEFKLYSGYCIYVLSAVFVFVFRCYVHSYMSKSTNNVHITMTTHQYRLQWLAKQQNSCLDNKQE